MQSSGDAFVDLVSSRPTSIYPENIGSNVGQFSLGADYQSIPVIELYMSQQNIDEVQKRIRYTVYTKTGRVIPPQKQTNLVIIMRQFLDEYGTTPYEPTKIKSEIDRLDNLVRDHCVSTIMREIKSFELYRRDVQERIFLDGPVNDSVKGTKVNLDPRNRLDIFRN